ncbi:hypothetical protein Tco_0837073 [Tanacetum coccineum]
MWEEFTQSIHSFVEDKKNMALHTQGKKKSNPLVIPSVRFTKLIIHHLQSKHKFHPRPYSPLHLPYEEYVLGYLKFSAKGTKREQSKYLAGEEVSDPDSPAPKPAKATKPKATKQSKPLAPKAASVTKPTAAEAPKPTASQQPSKKDQSIPDKEPVYGDEEADTQRAIEESLKEVHDAASGSTSSLVIREPDSGKISTASRCYGTGKEKVRHNSAPTEPSGHDESSSLYAELGMTDSETESDEEVPGTDAGDQDEGQAGTNPVYKIEGHIGSNPVMMQCLNLNPVMLFMLDQTVQENLKLTVEEHVILEEPASSTGTLSSLQHLTKYFSFGDQFFNDKPSNVKNEKTTAEIEAELMTIFPNEHRPLPAIATATATTTMIITTLLLPPQLQQSTTYSILIKRIGELEQHMVDLTQDNLALEERMDKHGSRLYKLENLDIPQHVSKGVDEIVTNAVDWLFKLHSGIASEICQKLT